MTASESGSQASTVRVATVFDAPPEVVWARVQRYETLRYIMRGLISFGGNMPERICTGDSLRLRLWFFHLLPTWMHVLAIAQVDEGERVIQSKESGGLVRRWDHRISVRPSAAGTTEYVDEIVIEAGPFTPLVCLWAHFQYRYRQRRWCKLLRLMGDDGGSTAASRRRDSV